MADNSISETLMSVLLKAVRCFRLFYPTSFPTAVNPSGTRVVIFAVIGKWICASAVANSVTQTQKDRPKLSSVQELGTTEL